MGKTRITIALFIFFIIAVMGNKDTDAQTFNWSVLGTSTSNGTNGEVYAIALYNGNIVAAGGFTHAGSNNNTRNIAMWNGTTWQSLGNGIGTGAGDTVYSLSVYNGYLYAGGIFATASGVTVNNITWWNGTSWNACGIGSDGEVRALLVYNSQLIMGGEFGNAGGTTANRIAGWNGSVWSSIGGGFNTNNGSKVFAFTIYNGNLAAGGRFNTAGGNNANNVAVWNGSVWSALGTGFGTGSDKVFALAVNNNILYAGGKASSVYNLEQWNGSAWSVTGGGVDNDVNTLASYKGTLIAGGNFKYANGLYVDRIAQWNGSAWSRMLTGMNEKVQALYSNISDTSLYAGGEFTTAGGKYAYHIAKWSYQSTSMVTGQVRYSDNGNYVLSGKAKILRRDVNTQEVIVVDSAVVTNGTYSLQRVPRDSTLRVIIFPNDQFDLPGQFDHFVPTYFPSTIDWAAATPVNPIGNLININVNVFRIDTTGIAGANLNVGGYAYLNFAPPFNQPGNYPYNSDAIIYLKQGNVFKGFGISNTVQQYSIPQVPNGTYDAVVYRVGYEHSNRQINVTGANLDTVNFYLDTNTTVIGIQNISSQSPEKFELSQNYPNPFNPSTKIKFSLTKTSFAEMKIYNILGQQVAVLVNESLKPGIYEVSFNASVFPSGVYFYRLVTNDFTETKKMVLIK